MKYVKPEVDVAEAATNAIQAIGPKDHHTSDNQGTPYNSPTAYEADE